MGMSWKVGRVAGIDVYLHPTFLLILLLPEVTRGGALGLALVLAAFGCVLLHEFGHALMARRFGIETSRITLLPIGGVASLTRLPRSPGAELMIALAGPAVNLAIAGGVLGLDLIGFFGAGGMGPLVTSLLSINLGLALFNMIPVFPMDGGRVLRALLSGWLGRLRATEIAAGLGRVLAVGLGVYALFNGMLMGAALAAFIYIVGGMELAGVTAEERRRTIPRDGNGQNIWFAPPGARWVRVGGDTWQLVPVVVRTGSRG